MTFETKLNYDSGIALASSSRPRNGPEKLLDNATSLLHTVASASKMSAD